MFDFTKNNIKGIATNDLLNNQLLSFNTEVDSTGEIQKQYAEFNNLKFIIVNETFINLNGSLHKYFNGGVHNYNDFTILHLVEVLLDLSNKFKINPFLSHLHNLEFGVNVSLPFKTKVFLNSILSYRGKEYEKETYNGKGYLIRFSFDHYDLKIYDKGLQYGLTANVLRFEIKVKKMIYFKYHKIEISKLSDLLNINFYTKLKKLLLEAFSDLLIYDNSIKLNEVPIRIQNCLINGRNPQYWIEEKIKSNNNFKKKRVRFRKFVLKYGKNNIQNTVSNLIENKCNDVLKIDISTSKKINEYLNSFNKIGVPELTTFETANIKTQSTQINTSYKELKTVHIKRNCITCGRDITNQKKGSVFCSEKLYGKEVKKCRNKNSNPRNNYKLKELKLYSGGFLLFDINELKITG